METIIIVGAGGLAQDIYSYLSLSTQVEISGILVDSESDYKKMNVPEKYLGKIFDYTPKKYEKVLVAVGENPGRSKIIEYFKSINADFFTFIHPTVILNRNTRIKDGALIGPYCIIGSNVEIGANCFLNKFCNIGHDSIIGDGLIMYPYAMIGGHCIVEDNVTIYTRATISPNLNIEKSSIVSAHVFLRKSIAANTAIYMKQNIITR